jgi:hypothetical protein
MSSDSGRQDRAAGAGSAWDEALARLLDEHASSGEATSHSRPAELTAETIASGGAYWVAPDQPPPLLALLPLSGVTGPVQGRRIRRRSLDGAIWLIDLRVWTEPENRVVRVVHEADWYRLRVAGLEPPLLPISYDVDVSTVCLEQYVTPTRTLSEDGDDPNAWLRRLHDDPLQPPPVVPLRAWRAGHLLGRRAIIASAGRVTTDLRVVSEPTDGGHGVVVHTIDEADWHIHSAVNPGVDMWRSYRSTPIEQVWIEG